MKPLVNRAAIMLLMITSVLYGEPTPVPNVPKAKATSRVREPAPQPTEATAVFVAQLRADGSVQKVLISRSTGNKVVDAQIVTGLSVMRFPPEILTKAERAKRQKVFHFTITAKELRKFRYLPKAQW